MYTSTHSYLTKQIAGSAMCTSVRTTGFSMNLLIIAALQSSGLGEQKNRNPAILIIICVLSSASADDAAAATLVTFSQRWG
jgi:hypothetical protein